jgi:ABC-type hemin transport system ATPase subunit
LSFDRPITIIVGENGTGKSTLLEGIAVLAGYDGQRSLSVNIRLSWSRSKKTSECRNSGSNMMARRNSDTPRFRFPVSVCVRTMQCRGEAASIAAFKLHYYILRGV